VKKTLLKDALALKNNVLVNPIFLTTDTLHSALGTPIGSRHVITRNAVDFGTHTILLKAPRKNNY
jgi:hypothetical protein